MNSLSDLARANAINLEVKKDGLTQRQSGDWQLRLTIAAIDMDQRITSAPMGTRFVAVLVEVGDDEAPIDHKAQERDKWRDLGPMRQAGMRCKEPIFWAFISEELRVPVAGEDDAAKAVRFICSIPSRADLDKPGNTEARTRWFELDTAYQAWKARENA